MLLNTDLTERKEYCADTAQRKYEEKAGNKRPGLKIGKGIFLKLSNKDLCVKRNKTKRKYKKVRKIALNNLKGSTVGADKEIFT